MPRSWASTARPTRAFRSPSVEKMRAALKEAGKTAEIVLYPDTPHAFFADYRPSYRKERGRRRLEANAGLVQEKRRGLIISKLVSDQITAKSDLAPIIFQRVTSLRLFADLFV